MRGPFITVNVDGVGVNAHHAERNAGAALCKERLDWVASSGFKSLRFPPTVFEVQQESIIERRKLKVQLEPRDLVAHVDD